MSIVPAEVDSAKPHSARICDDFFLGGKNHFAADREAAAAVLRNSPSGPYRGARNRNLLGGQGSTWPRRPGSGSSSTSEPGCPPGTTYPPPPLSAGGGAPPRPASSTPTTTRSSWVRGPCSPPPPKAAPPLSRPTCARRSRRRSCPTRRPARCLTSNSRSGSSWSPSCTSSRTSNKPGLFVGDPARGGPSGRFPRRLACARRNPTRSRPPRANGRCSRRGSPCGNDDPDVVAGLAFRGLELVPPGVVLVSEWRPDNPGPPQKQAEVNCSAVVVARQTVGKSKSLVRTAGFLAARGGSVPSERRRCRPARFKTRTNQARAMPGRASYGDGLATVDVPLARVTHPQQHQRAAGRRSW